MPIKRWDKTYYTTDEARDMLRKSIRESAKELEKELIRIKLENNIGINV